MSPETLPTPLALASPERSSIDMDSFKVSPVTLDRHQPPLQMATNYLKAQFSLPHHTVPSLGDALQARPERRGLSVPRAQDRYRGMSSAILKSPIF